MSKKASTSLITAVALLLLVAPIYLLNSNAQCNDPRFVNGTRHSQTPEALVAELIQQFGGLPKTNVDLSMVSDGRSHPELIYPLNEWEITHSSVSRGLSLWHDLFDDDPNYGIDAEVAVEYSDGTTQILRWSSWRYGLVICPFAFPRGDGPAGRIEVISSTLNPSPQH